MMWNHCVPFIYTTGGSPRVSIPHPPPHLHPPNPLIIIIIIIVITIVLILITIIIVMIIVQITIIIMKALKIWLSALLCGQSQSPADCTT